MIKYVYIENGKAIIQEYTGETTARTNIRKQLKYRVHLPTHVFVDDEEVFRGEDVWKWIHAEYNLE